MSDAHDDQGFSHHCPKCNHHNPTMCVMAGQVKGLKAVVDSLKGDRAKIRDLLQRIIDAEPHDCKAVDQAWDAIHEWMKRS